MASKTKTQKTRIAPECQRHNQRAHTFRDRSKHSRSDTRRQAQRGWE